MNKKSFLILIIPPLVFFFSGWIYSALVCYGDPTTEFFCFASSFILSVALYVIEIIAFVLTKKFLAKKINNYQLLFIICGIAFVLLFVGGGFSGFILKAAYSTKNISFCNILIGIRANWNKNLCITHIARETEQEFSCEKVSLEERASCYNTLAIKKGDPTICGKIRLDFGGSGGLPGGMIREMCYRYLAERKKDTTICEKAKEASEEWCIKDEHGYSIVVSNYPLFNCHKIAREECCKKYGEYIKEDCYKQVAK
ncbi:hypothetical protein KJA15_02985 [Patescibacteria group bacterium]|nr:hypothetical protein [Patescibacteria group bacterium]